MLTLTYIWKDSHDMQNTHWDFHVENYDDEDVKDQRGEPKCVNVSQMKLILRMTGIIFWGIKHRILTKAFLLTQPGINLAACCFLLINTFLADHLFWSLNDFFLILFIRKCSLQRARHDFFEESLNPITTQHRRRRENEALL